MQYTLNIYRIDKRCKSGERLVGTYTYDRKDDSAMEREVIELRHNAGYFGDKYRIEFYPKTKIVKNLMTGKDVEIDADTPWSCNPASEAYWSN